MTAHRFSVVDVILADDLRQENTGKLLVIGMYLGSILGIKFPLVLPTLAFLTKWRSEDGSLPEGTYSVVDPNGKVVAQIKNAATPAGPPRPFILAGNKLSPVRFDGPGNHSWTFTPKGGKPIPLAEFDVAVVQQGSAPTTSEKQTPTA